LPRELPEAVEELPLMFLGGSETFFTTFSSLINEGLSKI